MKLTIHRQKLDILLSKVCPILKSLDKYISLWQFLDKWQQKAGQLIVQGLSNTNNIGQREISLTILGQMTKILDRILTIFGQNLVKFQLFWQILDIDKTWTKVGQMLDKTWTFVQNLSKFCPTWHSTGAPSAVLFFKKKKVQACEKGGVFYRGCGGPSPFQ